MGTYTKEQLTDELNRIKTATSACRDAIYNKGVTSIPVDASLGSLATYASMITCDHPDILLSYIANSNTNASSSSDIADVYFDTGYKPSAYIEFSGVFSMPENNGNGALFGAYDTLENRMWFIPYSSGTNKFSYCNNLTGINWVKSGTPSGAGTFVFTSGSMSIYNHYDAEVITINGENSTTTRVTPTTTTIIDETLLLFARHNKGNADCKAIKGTKIKYICFYDKAVLVRFYIPVLHWHNGQYVPCFYDKVNDNYIYNLGSDPVYYESTGYTLLDSLYYTSSSPEIKSGFTTAQSITSFDRLHTRYSFVSNSNYNEQGLIVSRLSSSVKTGIYAKYVGGTSIGYKMIPGRKYTKNSSGAYTDLHSDITILPYQTATFSSYQTIVNNNWRPTFSVNGSITVGNTTQQTTTQFNNKTYNLLYYIVSPYIKMHYASLTNDYMNNSSNAYIPLLINNTPCFYELRTETAIYNTVDKLGYDILY